MKTYKQLKESVGGFGSFYSKSEKHAEIGRDHDDDHKSSRPAQHQKIYHKVAFKDKDSAKAEGMRYDGDKKKWYHTSAQKSNASKFVKEEVELVEVLNPGQRVVISSGPSMYVGKTGVIGTLSANHAKPGYVLVNLDHAAGSVALPATAVKLQGASKFAKEEVEQIDEIKLKTIGKIIKHSPKIASAAIGAAVAAHSAEPPKQIIKQSTTHIVKKEHK